MSISFREAMAIVAEAHHKAAQLGVTVTVVVVDEGGFVQAVGRMDGAPPLSTQIAEAKAVGAAVWHRPGESLAVLQRERPAFFEAVDRLVRMPLIPGLGSVLIQRAGVMLGAVGVSGAAPEQDLLCAEAGIGVLLDEP